MINFHYFSLIELCIFMGIKVFELVAEPALWHNVHQTLAQADTRRDKARILVTKMWDF